MMMNRRMFHLAMLAVFVLVPVLAMGCSNAVSQPVAKTPPVVITFSVATSTKQAIEPLAKSFEKQTGIVVKINAGPTNSLANQIIEGAPCDLFLSANRQWATKVEEAKLSKEQKAILTNQLVIVVPTGNPAGVKSPEDLSKEGVKKIALAGEKVPAGIYANQSLTKLGLLEALVADGKIARGQDVRNTLQFVERGEAEAGIVYSTDVKGVSGVETVYSFDPKLHDEIAYVLVLLELGLQKPQAKQFYDFLQSEEAERVFAEAGFERIGGR